jgi:hypothetical protein
MQQERLLLVILAPLGLDAAPADAGLAPQIFAPRAAHADPARLPGTDTVVRAPFDHINASEAIPESSRGRRA